MTRTPDLNMALLSALQSRTGQWTNLAPLARELSHPLEALVAEMQALLEFGFQIELHPHYGARYMGPAARLCVDQIRWGLQTVLVGTDIQVWESTTSTIDRAWELPVNAAGTVVLAEHQQQGRGRQGARWHAPSRTCVLFSTPLPVPRHCGDTTPMASVMSVATALAIERTTGVACRLKWPNDIQFEGRKLAGVLVEGRANQRAVWSVGINVNVREDQFPSALHGQVASLQHIVGQPIDRSALVRQVIESLDQWYDRWSRDPESAELWEQWAERSQLIGRWAICRRLGDDHPCQIVECLPGGVLKMRDDRRMHTLHASHLDQLY